ncbi:MAG: GNAT family N-acetyltransferase [Candidatus Thorarchaeota archaeon]
MSTLTASLQIRHGMISDCKDLLTVYQTTRWQQHSYTQVQQVKDEHRGRMFRRFNWLVAEVDDQVIGETIFATTERVGVGLVGVFLSLDIDVRHQKRGIGRELVRSAENAMAQTGAVRAFADAPPSSYNFWMKMGYFATRPVVVLKRSTAGARGRLPRDITMREISDFYHTPRALRFSNLAHVGATLRLAREILDFGRSGMIVEFRSHESIAGVGVVCQRTSSVGEFVVDVMPGHEEHLSAMTGCITRLARRMRLKEIYSNVPIDAVDLFTDTTGWAEDEESLVPVTRLL